MIVCLDFETYYNSDYSLSKLTIEEYVRSPKFEVIGCAISLNGQPPIWYPQPMVASALEAIDWSQSSLLCHNTAFDGTILGWIYNLYPKLYLDTMGMARATGNGMPSASLNSVAHKLGLGGKSLTSVRMMGKHYVDFSLQEITEYADYCKHDVSLTIGIYRKLITDFPRSELKLQDLILRMFIQPVLHFDKEILKSYIEDIKTQKWNTLAEVARLVDFKWRDAKIDVQGDVLESYDLLSDGEIYSQIRSILMSNDKFAELLKHYGIDPPTKLSPATGLETYALAKTDQAFIELQNHPDVVLQTLVSARLGVRSTIEETRTERFIKIAERGLWPVPYAYYAAHTGRLGGSDKVNPQNLKRKGKLRQSIKPPPGHVLVAGDLSQIECRVLNYWAGQNDIVEAFRAYDAGVGQDLYCMLASKIYNREVTPDESEPRIVGKIGELSLGFGGGYRAYKRMLNAQAGLLVSDDQSKNVVGIYRSSHPYVERLWYSADNFLFNASNQREYSFGVGLEVGNDSKILKGIRLPNGLYIHYPNLTATMNSDGKRSFYFDARRGSTVTYGSKIVENVVQALARIIMTDAMIRISQHLRIVLTTHDEIVCIAPIAEATNAAAFMQQEMIRPVDWAPGLPIACKVGIGENYLECK